MRIRKPLSALSVAAIAVFALLAFSAPAVRAQAVPAVTDGGVEDRFPDGMVFRVSAESDSPIQEIRLKYKVLPDGTSANGVPDFEPVRQVQTQFVLGGGDLYLSPGVVIEYYWEVRDESGATARTDTQTFFYDDSRFEWSSVKADGVTIFYYSGSEEDAQSMHDVAVEQLGQMSRLLGTEIPFEVQVWTYDSVDDMRPALVKRSESYESQIITAGVRVATNTVLVLGNVSFDTLRHELTHVVTAQAGESALGTLPAWLDEGTAVYGQKDPGSFQDAVKRAFDRGNVLSVREITAYPGDPAKVELFYGEGWSLVSYLVDTYGEEKFAQLFAEVKSGKRIDGALDAVYGFDQDGLEDEWRAAHDLPHRETQAPEPQETGQPSESVQSDGGGSSTVLVIGIGVGILLLAGLVALGGVAAAKRM